MNHRGALIFYFGLALIISWVLWAPYVSGRLDWTPEASPALVLFGALGPAIAAFIAAADISHESPGALAQALSPWRVPLLGWLMGGGGPIIIAAVGLLVQFAVSGDEPRLADALASRTFDTLLPIATLTVHLVCFGVGEEVGWRGLAFPILSRRFGLFGGALLVAIPSTIWSLPLLAASDAPFIFGGAGLLGWALDCTGGSLVLSWLYWATRGSLLSVAFFNGLLHLAMTNKAVDGLGLCVMGGLVGLAGLCAGLALWREDVGLRRCVPGGSPKFPGLP